MKIYTVLILDTNDGGRCATVEAFATKEEADKKIAEFSKEENLQYFSDDLSYDENGNVKESEKYEVVYFNEEDNYPSIGGFVVIDNSWSDYRYLVREEEKEI